MFDQSDFTCHFVCLFVVHTVITCISTFLLLLMNNYASSWHHYCELASSLCTCIMYYEIAPFGSMFHACMTFHKVSLSAICNSFLAPVCFFLCFYIAVSLSVCVKTEKPSIPLMLVFIFYCFHFCFVDCHPECQLYGC